MELTGKQRRKLRAFGHHLEPVVLIGQQGLTPGVIEATAQALFDHELIKVKVNEGERKEVADELARATGAELVQVLGKTVLLFKQLPEKSKYSL